MKISHFKFNIGVKFLDLSFPMMVNLWKASIRQSLSIALRQITIKLFHFILLVLNVAFAYEAEADYAFAISTPIGSHRFFMMLPGTKSEKPSGRCYEVDNSGKLKITWEVRGWYSRPMLVFLSSDGCGLVRMKQIETRKEAIAYEKPLGDEVFLEFYQKGKLVKGVYLKDIVKPKDLQADYSQLHYEVADFCSFSDNPRIASCQSDAVPSEIGNDLRLALGPQEEMFVMKTVQGEKLFFAMSSGKEIYRFRPDVQTKKE